MLIPGRVGFRQKGQGVVYPGQLSGRTYLSLVGLIGPFDDGLPDVSGKRLVRVRAFDSSLRIHSSAIFSLALTRSYTYLVPSAKV